MTTEHTSKPPFDRLVGLLVQSAPQIRAALMLEVARFRSCPTHGQKEMLGPLRAAFTKRWQRQYQQPVPTQQLRAVVDPPVPAATVLAFLPLGYASDTEALDKAVDRLLEHLSHRVHENQRGSQLSLFEPEAQESSAIPNLPTAAVSSVSDLQQLIRQGVRFPTIYADPPWPYSNTASRAAANNHYPTMTLDEICAEPIADVAEENAHLHLWTTNAFLREAFAVIEAWGFQYKSCFVWVKGDIGMGNYWRVSHEYLMLGVRGSLTFRDRTLPSWVKARRTVHSRKPGIVRALIERVSPGPYLELYGREELPASAWTVYGNQIEKRLF